MWLEHLWTAPWNKKDLRGALKNGKTFDRWCMKEKSQEHDCWAVGLRRSTRGLASKRRLTWPQSWVQLGGSARYSLGSHTKKVLTDFPRGPVVKNPPSNAGDAGSIPGQGTKIPHAMGQLSPQATIREPACHNYRAHTLWSWHAPQLERSPHAETRSPSAATKTQRSQK